MQQAYNHPDYTATENKDIAFFFGATEGKKKKEGGTTESINGHGSKIIFRDSYLTDKSAKDLLASPYTDMPYTEQKYENSIDRKTGTTSSANGGMRSQERVPAGTKFKVEFVINVFGASAEDAAQNETIFRSYFNQGIQLLNADYLGGSGSRGYGHVLIDAKETGFQDYSNW